MFNNDEIINSIIKSFHEKNNSHAFLLETNNIDACYKDVMNMIKRLNCKNETIDDCNVCHTIDAGTNPDIITVRPIKKEIGVDPIDNILTVFATQPLISKYSMYVICEADLLSQIAANKILKFLEEPEDGIVGFFITNRLSSMLPTITSRCDLINIRYGTNSILDLLNISDEEYEKYYNEAVHIIKLLNNSKDYERLVKSNDLSNKEREDVLKIFKLIYRIYVIKFENIVNNEYNSLEYAQELFKLIDEEDIVVLTKRIKLLEDFLNDYKFNVNKDLFINKLYMVWE
jgi:DNA polymerase III gamma/tau subunit